MKTWKIAEILRTKFRKILENREILSCFDILALSKCILYFDIFLVFRILILKFSRIRSQVKQVERSESKIQDLHRQVHEYESTVEYLQNQVKSLTAELLNRARDGFGAGRLSSGAESLSGS